ncbi:hypothetical protein LGW19_10195, partial [Streptococcus mutans]|nr:hypothetical protein [Streptococcus mutans]
LRLQLGASPTVQSIASEAGTRLIEAIEVTFQGEAITLEKIVNEAQLNGVAVKPTTIVTTGASHQFIPRETSPFIFQDVFRFSDWQLPTVASSFKVLRNDSEVGFDSLIFGGDTLAIQFNE